MTTAPPFLYFLKTKTHFVFYVCTAGSLSKNLLNKISGYLLVMKMLWLAAVAPIIIRGTERRNLYPHHL
ncbi:hypothetical protein HanPSC8_Chr04g0139331 [Helianthus annuus]|nr:hypothetical protein HanPSC8_Chr04g0139331 [Helianthus annuus]